MLVGRDLLLTSIGTVAVMWTATLAQAGVDVVPLGPSRAELHWQGHMDVFDIVQLDRPVHPSKLREPSSAAALVVTPSATAGARDRARTLGWSLVTAAGDGWLLFSDGACAALPGRVPSETSHLTPQRGRHGWGRWSLVREIVRCSGQTQGVLARSVGLSQSRVSRLLTPLREQDLVQRTSQGWRATEWDELVRWWLTSYPGPGGVTTWWYGLKPTQQQLLPALQVLQQAAKARSAAAPAISGDSAADLIAPWRRPTTLVLYAHVGADLALAGLTPAHGPDDATCQLVVPEDTGVWAAADAPPHPLSDGMQAPVVDGLQVLWDVVQSPGPDAAEQALRLQRHLRLQWERASCT